LGEKKKRELLIIRNVCFSKKQNAALDFFAYFLGQCHREAATQ
jgi:hypothetical protein